MATTELENLIQQIRSLNPEERRKVKAAIDTEPAASATGGVEDRFDQLLLRDGLIERIPPPVADTQSYNAWRPIPIEGKPLSETVIEERR
ncbi:MAG TPA: hypothetical protein VK797_18920 [Tepidisphaeraceae bacterium]|jgi:hypothetical protein|nr:hypothetical protein [Tepidisphaeraceae bacterium]